MTEKKEGMLSPYRVLDLTDEKGWMCGKLLGDLGADVIKIEPPGGDPGRNVGPFYHDDVDPEKSLYWFALNASKRGITLDIEQPEGQDIFKKLVKSADFVTESFHPGDLDRLGLGYTTLEQLNPGVIMVSITPFGQTGPYKDYKGPDIVARSLGGGALQWGDTDRPPVWIGYHPQLHFHAGTEAAAAAMIALFYRSTTGEGQQVDFSLQDLGARGANLFISAWDMLRFNPRRSGQVGQTVQTKGIWPCKDGYIIWRYMSGPTARRVSAPLLQWMEDEGMADDFIRDFDWDTFDLRNTTQETIDRLYEPTAKFFMQYTKAELLKGAVKYRLMLYPIATTRDILESVQLNAREFWQEVEHPELNNTLTYPGAFVNASETPPGTERRAPLIGEHNEEIYVQELGISKDKLQKLEQARVI